MSKFQDLTGQRFGRLVVIERAEDYIFPSGQKQAQWLCECSCENHNKIITTSARLKSGNTKSCGCLKSEAVKENIYTGKLMIDFDWILFPVANAIKDVDKTLTQMNKDLIAQAKQLVSLEKHVDKLESKVRTTFEKQEKMQYKLNDTKDILNKMENK